MAVFMRAYANTELYPLVHLYSGVLTVRWVGACAMQDPERKQRALKLENLSSIQ